MHGVDINRMDIECIIASSMVRLLALDIDGRFYTHVRDELTFQDKDKRQVWGPSRTARASPVDVPNIDEDIVDPARKSRQPTKKVDLDGFL